MPETGGEGSPDRRFLKLFLHLVLEIITCGDTSLNAIWAVATANPVAQFRIFLGTALGPWQAISDNAAPKSIQSTGVCFDARTRHNRSHATRRLVPWRRTPEETGVLPVARDDSAEVQRAWVSRASSAFRRRAVYAWRRLTEGGREPAVPAAMQWLTTRSSPGGVGAHGQRSLGLPGVDGRRVGDLHVLWAD